MHLLPSLVPRLYLHRFYLCQMPSDSICQTADPVCQMSSGRGSIRQMASGRLRIWQRAVWQPAVWQPPSGRCHVCQTAVWLPAAVWQMPRLAARVPPPVSFYVAIGLSTRVKPGNEARLNSCVFKMGEKLMGKSRLSPIDFSQCRFE